MMSSRRLLVTGALKWDIGSASGNINALIDFIRNTIL